MIRLGKAFIKVNGALMESMAGAKLDIGGVTRTSVVGANAVHGYAEQVKQARLECEISVGPETKLLDIAKFSGETITFECDTGQVFAIRGGWLVDTLVLTEGEGGKVPLVFEGPPAEQVN